MAKLKLEEITAEEIVALATLNRNKSDGIHYLEFVNNSSTNGALDLIQKGYAEKVRSEVNEDDVKYRLTLNGLKLLSCVQSSPLYYIKPF